jgi:thiamine-monophosphate kinase
MASESELIAALSAVFKRSDSNVLENVIIGIGDDGAVIAPSSHKSVLATDMAVEGVHFKREWSTLKEIGAKITAANLADIYAMGGDPKYLLVGAGLTPDFGISEITQLAEGIASEAKLVGASVVGGDISKADQLVISIAVFGEVENPITRSGAKVGDSVIISGLPGKSAAGLMQLKNGSVESAFISAHKKPVVNYEIAKRFRKVNSMCDVSDALVIQARQVADSSKVAFKFDLSKIQDCSEFAELESLARSLGIDVWKWIFAGGEDHVLLATGVDLPGVLIGEVIAGEGIHNVPADVENSAWRHF